MSYFSKGIFLLSLFVGFYILFSFRIVEKRKTVLTCEPSEISSITLRVPDRNFGLQRHPSTHIWKMSYHGMQLDTHVPTIQGFTQLLCRLFYLDKFSVKNPNKTSLEPYGVIQAERTILFTLGQRTLLLSMGNKTPEETGFYLRSSHNPEYLYILTNTIEKEMMPQPLDFYARHPIQLGKVKHIRMAFQERKITLARDSKNNWQSRQPKIPAPQVKNIIHLLSGLQYMKYYEPMSKKESYAYGFYAPDLVIQLESQEGTLLRYQISYFGSNFYFALLLKKERYLLLLRHQEPLLLFGLLKKLVFKEKR